MSSKTVMYATENVPCCVYSQCVLLFCWYFTIGTLERREKEKEQERERDREKERSIKKEKER